MIKRIDFNYKTILLSVLILIEFCFLLFYKQIPYKNWISVLYSILGLLIAIIASYQPNNFKYNYQENKINLNKYIIIIFVISLIYYIKQLNHAFNITPLNYKWADMLPILKIMAERFVSRKEVYAIIPEIWSGMQPIYLPAFYLPYSIAVLFNFDIRWINIAVLLIALCLIVTKNYNKQQGYIPIAIISMFLVFSTQENNIIWYTLTEEPLIYGYYLLLGFAIYQRKYILLLLILIACLLSRYTILFSAPTLFIHYWILEGRKKVLLTTTVVLLSCVILLWITGAINHISVFINVPDNYLMMLADKWRVQQFSESLGWFKFFNHSNYNILHTLSKVMPFIIPLIFYLFFTAYKKQINYNSILISSIKISMVVFYNLLIAPYFYLFVTLTLFSIIVFDVYTNEITS